MIERHDGRQQIVCDSCPASYPNTYADEDFAVMVADARTAGWSIRPAPLAAGKAATADLFAAPAAPRIAGKPKPQRFTHTCPSCRNQAPHRREDAPWLC